MTSPMVSATVPSNDYDTYFDGPVTALSVCPRSGTMAPHSVHETPHLCAGVGNQVFLMRPSLHDSPRQRRIALPSLPAGSVVTALASSFAYVLAGVGDTVLALALTDEEKRTQDRETARWTQVTRTHNGRIISLRFQPLGRGVFTVLTSANALLAITEEHLAAALDCSTAASMPNPPCYTQGPCLPMVLAGDCVALSELTFAVFAGTYGGTVHVWTASDRSTVATHTPIQAHVSSCAALFAVKAISLRHGAACCSEPAEFVVSTCADDRSAAVFSCPYDVTGSPSHGHAPEQVALRDQWTCLCRQVGPQFALTRVFDVDICPKRTPLPAGDDGSTRLPCSVVQLAAATEDGAVLCFEISRSRPSSSRSKDRNGPSSECTGVLARRDLHDGRGAFKTAFLDDGHEVYVVSGGFDGAVIGCRISQQDETRVPSHHQQRRFDAVSWAAAQRRMAPARKSRPRVRCVHVDAASAVTVLCTESEVAALHPSFGESGVLGHSWHGETSLHLSECVQRAKALLPSAVTLAADVVLIGTEAGNLMVWRVPSVGSVSSKSLMSTLDVWAGAGKCVKLTCVRLTPSTDAGVSRVAALSSHADGSVLVTAVLLENAFSSNEKDAGGERSAKEQSPHSVKASVRAVLAQCHGLQVTALEVFFAHGELCAILGDKSGHVRCYILSVALTQDDHEGANAQANRVMLQPCWSMRVFSSPIHTLSVVEEDLSPCGIVEKDSFGAYVTSDDGSNAYVSISFSSAGAPSQPSQTAAFSHPLQFPFECVRVLALTDTLCVSEVGTTVNVHERAQGQHGWCNVCSWERVKAPRLRLASIAGQRTAFVHCSDGVHVETVFHTASAQVLSDDVGSSVLHGGAIPGKDFNCAVALPHLSCFALGNENSYLCVQSDMLASHRLTVPRSLKAPSGIPISMCGAHRSNVLAMCVLESSPQRTRIASVGGLATVAVWEWTQQWRWRLVAVTSRFQHDHKTDMPAREHCGCAARTASSDERVPRFLAVSALGQSVLAVGGSDAALRLYVLEEHGDSTGSMRSTLKQCSLQSELRDATGGQSTDVQDAFVVSPECPKPLTALCRLDNSSCTMPSEAATDLVVLVAGDTNGRLHLVSLERTSGDAAALYAVAALDHHAVERSCVNALTPYSQPTVDGMLLASLHDSGNVHVHVSRTRTSLRTLHSCSTGLTAGRAVHWLPCASLADGSQRRAPKLLTVNDERVNVFSVDVAGECCLACTVSQRVTVRCVSGAAVSGVHGNGTITCAVVGQGVETIQLPL